MARKPVLVGLAAAVMMLGSVAVPTAASAFDVADSCTTAPAPPANVRASGGLSSTTIMLFWTIVQPPAGCTLAGFNILRAPGSSGGAFTQVAQIPANSSFTDPQLQPLTTYRYQVQSRTTSGLVSVPSNTVQATTSHPCFPQLPFPPALFVRSVTRTSVSLSWYGANPNCVVFDVLRATGATSTMFDLLGSTASSTFNDTSVAAATTYRYRVRARIVPIGLTWGQTTTVNVTTPA
jgi:endo-1,4-beta-xylanase